MESARQQIYDIVMDIPEARLSPVLDFVRRFQDKEDDHLALANLFAACMTGLEEEWDNEEDEVWNDV